jgi:hypothetical protein
MKDIKNHAEAIAFKMKSEKRQDCKMKLKKINDNIDDLDRLLSEINSLLEMIWKDAFYLKESEWSPVKGRTSILYGTNGDLEKEQEVIKQYRELEAQQHKYDDLKSERDELKKLCKQYQMKFD